MSFDDPLFLFGFIPIIVGLCAALRAWMPSLVTPALLLASMGFYLSSDPYGALVMFPMIAVTVGCIEALSRWPSQARAIATLGILLNIIILGSWKYAPDSFVIKQPFGLSFVVFLNISAIVDIYTNRAQKLPLGSQILYSGFFASVSAGPVTRYKDLAPQLERLGHDPVSREQIVTGLILCVVGLAKAVIVGRPLLVQVATMSQAVANGGVLPFIDAWFLVLAAFTGLYFVFSGYSDMALGLGSSLGLQLAVNFNSPFKAKGTANFFQRWHMSLSKWVEVYVFAPLSRIISNAPYGTAKARRTMGWALGTVASTTMIAAWHGATPFLALAGSFIGFWLVINQLPSLLGKRRAPRKSGWLGPSLFRIFFFATTAPLAFIYFSGSSEVYLTVIKSLVDVRSISLPGFLQGPFGALSALGIEFNGFLLGIKDRNYWIIHLALALLLTLAAPNTMELFGFIKSSSKVDFKKRMGFWLGLALGLMIAFSLAFLSVGKGFVYDEF